MKSLLRLFLITCCLSFSGYISFAQNKHVSFKDSLDNGFDFSDYIIDAHGFVPVPVIITEKALGGFGGALAPIFLKKKNPLIDTIGNNVKITPVAPDVTGAVGGYTANNSWFAGAFRSGTFIKPRIKYMVGAMYADINMSFYKELPQLGEKEFKFNIKSALTFIQVSKKISTSDWYAGLKYMYARTDVKYRSDSLMPEFVKPIEFSSNLSQLGAIVEFDNRDNVFTPDNGLKFHIDGICSNEIIGSDYDFWRMNYYTYIYKTLFRKLTAGLRIDGQQTFGDPPFYFLPYLDMRGVPVNRYQGKADLLSELELRWNFYKRWSVMLYSGAGKAFNDWSEWSDTKTVWTYGTGFRYLLARKFKLRVGVDVAKGPENWTYYIVFGSNWLK
jgi:hypothetical protein